MEALAVGFSLPTIKQGQMSSPHPIHLSMGVSLWFPVRLVSFESLILYVKTSF